MSVFTLGIEEEYFITDPRTRNTVTRRKPGFLEDARRELGGNRVTTELMQSQVEITSGVADSLAGLRAEMTGLRRGLGEIAARHGLRIVAAGTHPMAEWSEQRRTDKARYATIAREFGIIARRNMMCGQHVHVELPDPARRVEIMMRVMPFLPLFLALSTSSPFWKRHRTGLLGYRMSAQDELPRTGMPEMLRGEADWNAYVATLVDSGVVADGSYVWWTIRPSVNHPTLEMRIADCCTTLDDALMIAALYRCLARRLWLDPSINAEPTVATRAIAEENRWRAQRYGIDGSLLDEAGRRLVSVPELVEQLLALIAPDAAHFGCEAEVAHARTILARGTSAHRQIDIYDEARAAGRGRSAALMSVVDWLAEETLAVGGPMPAAPPPSA